MLHTRFKAIPPHRLFGSGELIATLQGYRPLSQISNLDKCGLPACPGERSSPVAPEARFTMNECRRFAPMGRPGGLPHHHVEQLPPLEIVRNHVIRTDADQP